LNIDAAGSDLGRGKEIGGFGVLFGGLSLAMKRLIVIGALLAGIVASTNAHADLKIAYVDVQRALNECSAGKKAKADFRIQIERLEGKLSKQQNEVQSLKDELEKKGMLMKEDERRNLQDEYARKLRDFERSYKDSKDELERKDNEVTGAIVRDLARVIRSLGEKDGYTAVFEKGGILWGAPQIDITDQVIRAYNTGAPAVGSLEKGQAPSVGSLESGSRPAGGAQASTEFGEEAAKKSTISK
jgi:outer membrane protein